MRRLDHGRRHTGISGRIRTSAESLVVWALWNAAALRLSMGGAIIVGVRGVTIASSQLAVESTPGRGETVRRGTGAGIIGAGAKCVSRVMIGESNGIERRDLLGRESNIRPGSVSGGSAIIETDLVLIKRRGKDSETTGIQVRVSLAR